jgi:hypothetical protein
VASLPEERCRRSAGGRLSRRRRFRRHRRADRDHAAEPIPSGKGNVRTEDDRHQLIGRRLNRDYVRRFEGYDTVPGDPNYFPAPSHYYTADNAAIAQGDVDCGYPVRRLSECPYTFGDSI